MSETPKVQPTPFPLTEIRSGFFGTEVYIDGKKIEDVESISFEYDPMKDLNPILSLRIRACNFRITSNEIPLLPAPWREFYQLKPEHEGLTDMEHLEKIWASKNQSQG